MNKFWKYGRLTLFILSCLFIAVAVIHIISAYTIDRIIAYTEISYSSPRLPKDMDGYVIAFIVDTHDIGAVKLAQIVERVNARNVDLLLLGGDYSWHDSDETMRILTGIKTRDGVFGVEGNHDSFKDLKRTMPKYGYTLLADEGLGLKPGFYLGGMTFTGGDGLAPSIKNALANARPDDFILLLTHNPDNVQMQNSSQVDLALAGHTHGGEVTLFGLWAPALKQVTIYGHKFKSGWVETTHGSKMFISRGIGTSGPIRVFSQPEVIFITLKAE